MSFTFQIAPVLVMFRAFILADLTAQSQVPSSLPYLFTAAQYLLSLEELPLTCIEVKNAKFDRYEINAVKITLPIIIHCIVQRTGNDNAELNAIATLSHIAASIESDQRLSGLDSDTEIDKCIAHEMFLGNDCPDEIEIQESDQNSALSCVSLPCEIYWYEGKY
jgi:hypothetical protein